MLWPEFLQYFPLWAGPITIGLALGVTGNVKHGGFYCNNVGLGQLEGKLRWLLGGRMVWRCIAAGAAALPRSESSLEVSEELPEWVQNCMPLVSLVFH